jgi:signal transduction histidine kinase
MSVSMFRRVQFSTIRAEQPYRGPDRRSRTVPVATLPLARVVPTTLVVCIDAGVPAVLIAVGVPSSANEAAYLLVTSGLLALAAGLTCLVSWRIVGLALPGRLGVGLVVLGALTFIDSAFSRFGVQSAPGAQPFDQLVIAVITGWLVWQGLDRVEVNAAFAPIVTLVVFIGGGTFVLGILRVLQARQIVPASFTSPVAHMALQGAAAAVWLVIAGLASRSREGRDGQPSPVAPLWVACVALVLGLAAAARVLTPFATWWAIIAAAIQLLALAMAFGSSLGQVQELLRSEDHLQLRLGRALDDTRHQAAVEHEELEELLHDLRNAVASLRAADAVLRQSGTQADRPAQVMLADAVTAEIARLEVLIDPARPLRLRDVSLDAVLRPVVTAERSLGARIDVAVRDLRVLADRDYLSDLVQNLLANARRYAPRGHIVVSAVRAGQMVELSVHDDGPGIPPHERFAVFQRGVRGSTSAGTDGSGLGLYVARKLAQTMGGSIRLVVDGTPGARFVVTLPIGGRPDENTAAPEHNVDPQPRVAGGQLRPAS